jgi:hypothetical protein
MTRSTLSIVDSKRVNVCVCVRPGVSYLNFMHSHSALHTSSELSDTFSLFVDLLISRIIAEDPTGTHSNLESIFTFDHRTEVFGNIIPQLSPFEILLAK